MAEVVGQTLDGRFRIDAYVGAGAMASVYRALDVTTGATVALKVMKPHVREEPELVARFRREFAACAKLDHPNVVRLHHLGELPDGSWYYTMEFLPHPSLGDLLRAEGPPGEARTRTLLLQATDALAAAHGRGVVHRDLKPNNLVVAGDRLVVVDFGLARDADRTKLTETGTLMGTPYYMPPEALLGKHVDARADVYAVGVIAFELLTGRHPFEAEDLETLFTLILNRAAPAPSSLAPGLAPAWDPLVCRCLAKEPDDRYSTMEELHADLVAFGATATTSRARARPAPVTPAPVTPSPVTRRSPVAPRRRWPLAALVLPASLAAWLALRPAAHEGFLARDLRVEPGAAALIVRWSTDRPCPSLVRLDGAPPRDFVGQAGAEVTSHEVLVAPLVEGRAATVRVVSPLGQLSLPRSGTPTRLRVDQLGAEISAEGLRLRWRCRAGVAQAVSLRPAGTWPSCPARRQGEDRWEARLGSLPPDADGLAVEVTLPGAERPVLVELAPVLRAELEAAVRPVTGLDFTRFRAEVTTAANPSVTSELERLRRQRGADLGELEADVYKEVRRAAEGPLFTAGLASRGLLAAWGRLVDLSPLVFLTRLAGDEPTERAYLAIQAMVRLERYSRCVGLSPPLALPGHPALGDFASATAPTPGPDQLVPLALPADRTLAPPRAKDLRGPRARMPLTFDLGQLEGLEQAELVLTVQPFQDFPLRVRANDRPDLWLFPGRRDRQDGSERMVMVQRLPLRWLRKGANALELVADRYLDALNNPATVVHEAHVALWFSTPRR